jgi:hypothetical protein
MAIPKPVLLAFLPVTVNFTPLSLVVPGVQLPRSTSVK